MTAVDSRTVWLQWRRAGIGASDVAAIAEGIYGGTYAVVADKLGLDVDLGDNQAEKDRGHGWEARIADAVQALTGLYVAGEQMWCEHPEHPTRRATVDGFLATQIDPDLEAASMADVVALLEIKTVGEYADHHWARWSTQTQWQMHVTGIGRALIVAATVLDTGEFGGMRVRWVDADPEAQAALVDIADEAWTWVAQGELPDPDAPSALEYVKHLTMWSDDQQMLDVVDLDDIADEVARFGAIKAAESKVKAEREVIEARIKARIGSATKGVTSDGWRFTYSANSRVLDATGEEAVLLAYPELGKTVLDKDAAKALLGKQLDEFKSPVGARRLTITPPKENR